MLKKVLWQKDWGAYAPFCPYCSEYAYEKDHCVFCGKKYEWDEPKNVPKPTIVEHKGFTIIQTTNNHLQMYKDNRIVMHASCTTKMTEDELRAEVDRYENMRKDR